MDLFEQKTPRKRAANFTAEEKALLTKLIKQRPIIETKLTDGKSIAQKQAAWNSITKEFNCNANVQKRETLMLKRLWDNMKSFSRRARTRERRNKLHCERDKDKTEDIVQKPSYKILETMRSNTNILEDVQNSPDETEIKYSDTMILNQVPKPTDYIRREAIMRIKYLKNKKNLKMQILKTQLEAEQIKKNAAVLEEERNKILLEKARIELDEVKKSTKVNVGSSGLQ